MYNLSKRPTSEERRNATLGLRKMLLAVVLDALNRNVYKVEFFNLELQIEPISPYEYAVMTEIEGEPFCVGHI